MLFKVEGVEQRLLIAILLARRANDRVAIAASSQFDVFQ